MEGRKRQKGRQWGWVWRCGEWGVCGCKQGPKFQNPAVKTASLLLGSPTQCCKVPVWLSADSFGLGWPPLLCVGFSRPSQVPPAQHPSCFSLRLFWAISACCKLLLASQNAPGGFSDRLPLGPELYTQTFVISFLLFLSIFLKLQSSHAEMRAFHDITKCLRANIS